jgi:hypothetical protein
VRGRRWGLGKEAGNRLKERSRSPWTGSRRCSYLKVEKQEMNFRRKQEIG